MYLAEN